jgi:hypothetical protein
MGLDRRRFLQGLGGGALAAAALGWPSRGSAALAPDTPERLAAELHRSLSQRQRSELAFPWDHVHPERGLLRARVSANWMITRPSLESDFFSADQRALARAIFDGLIDPAWHERYERKLEDDSGGFGRHQAVAFFGDPDAGPFQFVTTGRHLTLRADGGSSPGLAFGGPVFYGHATGTWWSGSFVERAHHPGNVFFHQALAASALYDLLDGSQREAARIREAPDEHDISFSPEGARRGLALTALWPDQRAEAERLLDVLVEPFRSDDRAAVRRALAAQGGLARCHLSFFEPWYRRGDERWDSFRLEGPSLTWHFRGDPHVHVWVHVASDPGVPVNAVPIDRRG